MLEPEVSIQAVVVWCAVSMPRCRPWHVGIVPVNWLLINISDLSAELKMPIVSNCRLTRIG